MNIGSMVSPKILSIKWGEMEIEAIGKGRDFKLWPGGGRSWDWGETGTHHSPGIQIADVKELIQHGSQVIVLTKGFDLQLLICSETLNYLKEKGIDVVVGDTAEGVERYNDFIDKGELVGGLFHSTC